MQLKRMMYFVMFNELDGVLKDMEVKVNNSCARGSIKLYFLNDDFFCRKCQSCLLTTSIPLVRIQQTCYIQS